MVRRGEHSGKVGVEVMKDMTQWFAELQATHNTCVWDFKQPRNFLASRNKARSYYMLAIQKELGEAKCLPELNCAPHRIHPTIPSTCGSPGVWQG
jgi:hypothetical protein